MGAGSRRAESAEGLKMDMVSQAEFGEFHGPKTEAAPLNPFSYDQGRVFSRSG
jgi:hypothetical protein